jgi:hypothetical protein
VEALVQSHHQIIRHSLFGQRHPDALRRMATILATVPDFSTGLREHGGGHRVAAVSSGTPGAARRTADRGAAGTGDHRHLGEIASTPVSNAVVSRVIAGEVPHGVMGAGAEIELVFPLRAGGNISGALVLTTGAADAFTRLHLAMAQQVADGIAPWVELLRRAAPTEASFPRIS